MNCSEKYLSGWDNETGASGIAVSQLDSNKAFFSTNNYHHRDCHCYGNSTTNNNKRNNNNSHNNGTVRHNCPQHFVNSPKTSSSPRVTCDKCSLCVQVKRPPFPSELPCYPFSDDDPKRTSHDSYAKSANKCVQLSDNHRITTALVDQLNSAHLSYFTSPPLASQFNKTASSHSSVNIDEDQRNPSLINVESILEGISSSAVPLRYPLSHSPPPHVNDTFTIDCPVDTSCCEHLVSSCNSLAKPSSIVTNTKPCAINSINSKDLKCLPSDPCVANEQRSINPREQVGSRYSREHLHVARQSLSPSFPSLVTRVVANRSDTPNPLCVDFPLAIEPTPTNSTTPSPSSTAAAAVQTKAYDNHSSNHHHKPHRQNPNSVNNRSTNSIHSRVVDKHHTLAPSVDTKIVDHSKKSTTEEYLIIGTFNRQPRFDLPLTRHQTTDINSNCTNFVPLKRTTTTNTIKQNSKLDLRQESKPDDRSLVTSPVKSTPKSGYIHGNNTRQPASSQPTHPTSHASVDCRTHNPSVFHYPQQHQPSHKKTTTRIKTSNTNQHFSKFAHTTSHIRHNNLFADVSRRTSPSPSPTQLNRIELLPPQSTNDINMQPKGKSS